MPETTPASEKQRWEETTLKKALDRFPERRTSFTNLSNNEVGRLYTQEDLDRIGFDYEKDLGYPGEFPYTRGVQPTMYRGRFWTMRQFAGFGTARETNERFKYLLSQGQTGLSTAFDFPTLQGFDSDHEWALGEVGKVGVAIDTQQDMETLFSGINLADVSVSMTINGPAPMIWAFYLGAAEKQGVPMDQLRGTIQNDILKEYQAQKMFIFPPEPSIELVLDTFEYGAHNTPLFNPVSISGYHIREAGSTAVQELAFTLANGMDFVRRGIARGMDPDTFAPRLSFFFNAHNDFFEEIAKFRAARRIWARFMRNDIGAKNPKSWLLRFHTQTAGMTCTREQPENNIVRVGLQALAAVLGGTQSLHTNSFDEALGLPTEFSARIARNTQLILAEETGVTRTVDPLAGSYFIEKLTADLADRARSIMAEIDELGGMTKAIASGMPKLRIEESAAKRQARIDRGEEVVVGVNKYTVDDAGSVDVLDIDNTAVREQQVALLTKIRAERDQAACDAALAAITEAARGDGNLLAACVTAARARATVGEMSDAMEEVFGRHAAVTRTISGVYGAAYAGDEDFAKIVSNVEAFAIDEGRRPRILVAKMGQDGHDRGAKVIATAFADIGFDVDVGPLFQTPAEVARDAVDNDVHIVGISSQAAGHKTLVPQLIDELRSAGANNVVVVCGGVIPPQDYEMLRCAGVGAIFGPGTNIPDAAAKVLELVRAAT